MNTLMRRLVPLLLALSAGAFADEGGAAAHVMHDPLRVCVDPGNMPLSNDHGEGFQNRIGVIIASALGTQATWFYRPYLERGLTRQTFDNNECDLLMDMSPDDDRMIVSRPLYRSTFVLVYRNDRGYDIHSLDDPRLLRESRVGVFQHSAIRTALQEHGLDRENTVVRTISHNADQHPEEQPHHQVQDVIDGKLDVAAIWGPMAGWYARKGAPLVIQPVNLMEDRTPMEFSLAIGFHRGARRLKADVEWAIEQRRDEIRKVFDDFGVPLVHCDDCFISGSLPSHGPYKEVVLTGSAEQAPLQSLPADLPARIDAALKQGSTLEQELLDATLSRDGTRTEYLLKRGANVNASDTGNQTALMLAVQSGDVAMINGLLAYGADPNRQDNDGWTAAMHAVRGNDARILRLLASKGADFSRTSHDGLTALGLAVYDDRQNAAVAMLDSGARADDRMGSAHYTPLMVAAEKGNLTMAQALLQYGAKVDARNAGGLTALMIAAARNHDSLVTLLLKAGADPELRDEGGNTALALARAGNAARAEKALEAKGS